MSSSDRSLNNFKQDNNHDFHIDERYLVLGSEERQRYNETLSRRLGELIKNDEMIKESAFMAENTSKRTREALKERISDLGNNLKGFDMDFLAEQLILLKRLDRRKKMNKKGIFLDVKPFRDMGLLGPNDSLAILPTKIKELHQKIADQSKRQVDIYRMNRPLVKRQLSEIEQNRIKKESLMLSNIQKSVSEITKYNKGELKRDIKNLQRQIDELIKAENNRAKNEIPFSEVVSCVEKSGGNPNDLKQVGDFSYMLGKKEFTLTRDRSRGDGTLLVESPVRQTLESFVAEKYRPPFSTLSLSRT